MRCTCCDARIAVGEVYYDIENDQMCQACFDFWVDDHKQYNEPDDADIEEEVI